MYTVLLAVQLMAMIFNFACVVLLISQKSSTPAKYMLVTCICSLVQNAGYLMEMRSTTLQQAMMAIRMEYLGGAFIVTLLMIFVFKYCHIRMAKWLRILIFGLDILVFLSVWFSDYIPIYYKSVEFVETGVMPHVVLEKGILYLIFAVFMYGEFASSAVASMMSFVKANDVNMKKNYMMLFLCCTLPLLFYIGGVFGIIEGYDTAPIGGTVGILVFGFAIIKERVFDVVETAHENILMELNDAVVVLDYKRGFQEANKAALDIFPELSSMHMGQLVTNEVFDRIFEEKDSDETEINGKFYKVHVNELYSHGVGSKFIGYTVVLFDVTKSRKQLQTMTELKVAADSANQAKSAFLANVSHEIRTPINVVVGMSDVILRDYKEPQLQGYAQNIQTAAHTLLDLINDILDFSKIEAGHVDLIEDKYRVDDFFKDIIMVFEHKGEEKNLSFSTDISADIPLLMYGDIIRIRQIVTNILTNAFKYTKVGGVTLKAKFDKLSDKNGNLIISVEDTGIGIKEDELGKVFEMFVRLDERINKSVEGTGLGLNITKKLVDLMGGDIKIYSEYGKGSVFTVTIPQEILSRENECIGEIKHVDKVIERNPVGYEAPDAKVLIIDDSKTNLIVAKALLRDTKVKVSVGNSGEQCIEMVSQEHFDVIFLDHRMPEMDGIETFKEMKKIHHKCEDTPVIMLTANAISNAKDYYLGEGFADFMSKPISEESITKMLKKYLPEQLIKEV